jgi:multidrug efflux pump subunit AcrA (membrane-fusion protein)
LDKALASLAQASAELDFALRQVEVQQAEANLKLSRATLEFARQQEARYRDMAEREAVSVEEYQEYKSRYDQAIAQVEYNEAALQQARLRSVSSIEESRANVLQAAAQVDSARLDLSYCDMYSPISGQIGQSYVDVGNLVGQDDATLLVTINQMDPMQVHFSPGQQDWALIARELQAQGVLSATVEIPGVGTYQHPARLDFVDNTFKESTATILLRLAVPNPELQLRPSQYVRVFLHVGSIENALLVPQVAIAQDQGGTYVWALQPDQTVKRRSVTVKGQYDSFAITDSGLHVDETVLTSVLQSLQPGKRVQIVSATGEQPAQGELPQ